MSDTLPVGKADGGLADYLLDHYGACRLGAARCACLRGDWLGRACPHRRTAGSRTYAELRLYQPSMFSSLSEGG